MVSPPLSDEISEPLAPENERIDPLPGPDTMGVGNPPTSGAIGFDWFSAGAGGVSWLISLPRKKLITQQLPLRSLLWPPDYGDPG